MRTMGGAQGSHPRDPRGKRVLRRFGNVCFLLGSKKMPAGGAVHGPESLREVRALAPPAPYHECALPVGRGAFFGRVAR